MVLTPIINFLLCEISYVNEDYNGPFHPTSAQAAQHTEPDNVRLMGSITAGP